LLHKILIISIYIGIFLVHSTVLKAQSVGLVLSGGGSSGVAHIGVLKALEENDIPIDYIAGTSMGGLIAGLYASGYSPSEIEELFLSEKFRNWAQGTLNKKYIFYLRQQNITPSLVTFKLNTDTLWEINLPTNLISPGAINYGLMEYFAPASAKSKNNFDSLFIPFRCVASDIITKKAVVLKKGKLPTAVRASMAYPFYLPPIAYDSMLLFDGGLYNNFPSNVIYNDFNPDFIIGSNVSSNFLPPNEDNVVSQIKAIISNDTEYIIPCEYSMLIEPEASNFSTFNFDNNEQLIQIGYLATLNKIADLQNQITRKVTKVEVEKKRATYKATLPPLIFNKITVSGLSKKQNHYIEKSLQLKRGSTSAEILKSEYTKISSDNNIKSLYPEAIYNDTSNLFSLNLHAKKEKNLFISFGGVFSSRPVSTGYIGLQYNLLRKVAHSFTVETYLGRLTNSLITSYRIDVPGKIPFYWQTIGTSERWDYFRSNTTFFEDTKPSFLLSNEQYIKSEIGLPIRYKNKILFGGTFGELNNKYYQTRQFISTDTTDVTSFKNHSLFINFDNNSLDLKQYASKGSQILIEAKYVSGRERTVPGSTSIIKDVSKSYLSWILLKAKVDNYFNKRGWARFGVMGEVVYSTQPFFENYTASVLAASSFQPITESVALFQERLRAKKYVAGGAKTIFEVYKNTQLRIEGYIFQPYQEIIQNEFKKGELGKQWATRQYIFSSSLVYQTPIGPLAFNLNYYDKQEDRWTFLFHFGYFIFNKKNLQ